MDEAILIRANEIKQEIKRIDNAISCFKDTSPPSRVAVSTSFRHSNPRLHELDLSEDFNNRLKKVLIDMLYKEKENLLLEFNAL